jgi:hypothetical protein
MVRTNEADFNLRETDPPSRNILHSQRPPLDTREGERTHVCIHAGVKLPRFVKPTDEPQRSQPVHLHYPVGARDTAKSGMGWEVNRHLHSLAESVCVNVGDSSQDVKTSRLSITVMKVGAVIVVSGWESQLQGEGPQSDGISAQINRMATGRNLS